MFISPVPDQDLHVTFQKPECERMVTKQGNSY